MLYNHITEFKSNEPYNSDVMKKSKKKECGFDWINNDQKRVLNKASRDYVSMILFFFQKNMSSGGAAGH